MSVPPKHIKIRLAALDDFGTDGARMTEILDGIPGAWERTQEL